MGKVGSTKKQGSKDALRSALMALYAKDTGALRGASQKDRVAKKAKVVKPEPIVELTDQSVKTEVCAPVETTTQIPQTPVVLGEPILDEKARPFITIAYQQSEDFSWELKTGALIDLTA